jgi:HEAT repeat protein
MEGTSMTDLEQFATHHIERLRNDRDAFFPLIEADDAIVPILIEACKTESDPGVRAELVEIIWQHRVPETVEFLSEALVDDAPEVWKNALDGLVALGGEAAINALESARNRGLSHRQGTAAQAEWIDEAIQQIKQGHV